MHLCIYGQRTDACKDDHRQSAGSSAPWAPYILLPWGAATVFWNKLPQSLVKSCLGGFKIGFYFHGSRHPLDIPGTPGDPLTLSHTAEQSNLHFPHGPLTESTTQHATKGPLLIYADYMQHMSSTARFQGKPKGH